MLAPYASRPEDSRGRLHLEPESRRRSCFQRDRDRIIHSTAFRRLKHKTQVFIAPLGDHFRTRLTHSLEVAQIARSMSRSLGVDEDLTEALALAHDFGHPPFGHAGETALDEVMNPFGGFDHNEQTLRILVLLEQRYPRFDGLNLTWETLEGVVKHNGPLNKNCSSVPSSILYYCEKQDLELHTQAGLEAQIAAIADDIAYDNHDIDDGLRARAFSKEDLAEVDYIAEIFAQVRHEYPDAEESRITFEAVRRMIGEMVEDVLSETKRRITANKPRNANEIRELNGPLVAFSENMARKDSTLKQFLFRHMYRHRDVIREVERAKHIILDLFKHFLVNVGDLPAEWRRQAKGGDEIEVARVIADYIAGMTDNYALNCHEKIFKADART
ncbi:MAG: Deoxyguanosinetriphosphate triphosphohydrolase-like protein [Alphaproteobacteria bacterium MarineAlpha4_Bin2]|nr:MAG: Deoxyguanosinetriphosphate triphosphohydrolase-like protein [Alphaproteobacteria bacterium MarineAlpha4_Bin2]